MIPGIQKKSVKTLFGRKTGSMDFTNQSLGVTSQKGIYVKVQVCTGTGVVKSPDKYLTILDRVFLQKTTSSKKPYRSVLTPGVSVVSVSSVLSYLPFTSFSPCPYFLRNLSSRVPVG